MVEDFTVLPGAKMDNKELYGILVKHDERLKNIKTCLGDNMEALLIPVIAVLVEVIKRTQFINSKYMPAFAIGRKFFPCY